MKKTAPPLLIPDVELEGWWTNLTADKDKVIELYKGHALCEQYHSELKSDMDLGRLPSGKFATNTLVMCCVGLTYNILRAVGQVGLMGKKHARRAKQRRRIKTVMQDLVYFAGRFIRHARGLTLNLRFSCHAHDQAEAFAKPTTGLPKVEPEPVQHYPGKTTTVGATADARPKTRDHRQRGIKSAKLSKNRSTWPEKLHR